MKRLLMKQMLLSLSLVTFFSCSKDEAAFTGKLNLIFDNVNFYNQDNFFVRVEILIDKNDIEPLIELGTKDISKGSSAIYTLDNLNFGNYYVRYALIIGNTIYRENYIKPVQINVGKTATIKIDL